MLTHGENVQKARNKPLISINVKTRNKKTYISLKSASFDLEINISDISEICKGKQKTATSKKDKEKYSIEFVK